MKVALQTLRVCAFIAGGWVVLNAWGLPPVAMVFALVCAALVVYVACEAVSLYCSPTEDVRPKPPQEQDEPGAQPAVPRPSWLDQPTEVGGQGT